MRKRFPEVVCKAIAAAVFYLPLTVLGQYVLDWKNAPFNPVPEPYTLNHFNLKGNVITRTHEGITETFKDGKLVRIASRHGNDIYTYNNAGHLQTHTIDGMFASKINYTCDKQGRVVSWDPGAGNAGFTCTYNSKGLYKERRDRKTNALLELHEYDKEGRIVLTTSYGDDGKVSGKLSYSYSDRVSLWMTVIERYENTRNPKYNRCDTMKVDMLGFTNSRNGKPVTSGYDAMDNLITYVDAGSKVLIKYEYTYGGSGEDGSIAYQSQKAEGGVEGLGNPDAMPEIDKQLNVEIENQLKSLVSVQEGIKKLKSTSLVPWQKREIAAKTHAEIKKVVESLQQAKLVAEKRADLAKGIQHNNEIGPTQQTRAALAKAYTQAGELANMLDAKTPFETFDAGKWNKLVADLDDKLHNTAREIIAANELVGPNKKNKRATKGTPAKQPADLKFSEMMAYLTDLETYRLGFINFGMVEMQESIKNDFYMAALKAAGNQPLLAKLLINENARQRKLSTKADTLTKNADSAIAICFAIGKANHGILYDELKKEFTKISTLSNKYNLDISSSGDLTKKDAAALMEIVTKSHPALSKINDIIFGIVKKVPPIIN